MLTKPQLTATMLHSGKGWVRWDELLYQFRRRLVFFDESQRHAVLCSAMLWSRELICDIGVIFRGTLSKPCLFRYVNSVS